MLEKKLGNIIKKIYQSTMVITLLLSINSVVFASSNDELVDKLKSMKMVTEYKTTTSVDELETITFGRYNQKKDEYGIYNKEAVEWILVYRDDRNALLMSKYILDCKPFNNERPKLDGESMLITGSDVSYMASDWKRSTLRKWMNDYMYNEMFDASEKELISTAYLDNKFLYDTGNYIWKGNNTEDNLFILNEEELYHFFGKNNREDEKSKLKATRGTDYAVKMKKLSTYSGSEWYKGNGDYWIRPKEKISDDDLAVIKSSGIYNRKISIEATHYGIRPCVFIKLKQSNDMARIDLKEELRKDEEDKDKGIPLDTYETITLGHYANKKETKDIEWYVVKKENGRALVLSKTVLGKAKFYNKKIKEIADWENSDIRTYLNGEFYNTTFSDEEKKKIKDSNIKSSNHPKESVKKDKYTLDKIFLLSYEEVAEYIGVDNKNLLIGYDDRGYNANWDLRTPGDAVNEVCMVARGVINLKGAAANMERNLRPAMWVELE